MFTPALTRNQVSIKKRACKNFALYRPRKDILFKTKIVKIDTLKKKQHQHTLAGRTSPLSPYEGREYPPHPGVPPPPPGSPSKDETAVHCMLRSCLSALVI